MKTKNTKARIIFTNYKMQTKITFLFVDVTGQLPIHITKMLETTINKEKKVNFFTIFKSMP